MGALSWSKRLDPGFLVAVLELAGRLDGPGEQSPSLNPWVQAELSREGRGMHPRMGELAEQQIQRGVMRKANRTGMGDSWNSGKNVDMCTWPHLIHIHSGHLFPTSQLRRLR